MRNYALVFWMGIIFLIPFHVSAQDPHYSQFWANSLYLNPALTGYSTGTELHTQFRNQWFNILPQRSKFQTQSFSFSSQIPDLQSGFGLMYNGNTEGESLLIWHSIGISYAFIIPFWDAGHKKYRADVRFGLSGTRNWRSIDWDRLVFSPQLDPIYGITSTTQVPGSYTDVSSANYWDINFGFIARIDGSRLGFSINHLNQPNQSLLFRDAEIKLPRRFTLHGSHIFEYDFPTLKSRAGLKGQIIPGFKLSRQGSIGGSPEVDSIAFLSLDYGVNFALKPNRNPRYSYGIAPYVGIWNHHRSFNFRGNNSLRNTNALIFLLGFQVRPRTALAYNVSFSYEYNYSGLGSDTFGAIEAAIRFNFNDLFIWNARSTKQINVNRKCPLPGF